jgi:hypothetical protein
VSPLQELEVHAVLSQAPEPHAELLQAFDTHAFDLHPWVSSGATAPLIISIFSIFKMSVFTKFFKLFIIINF